MALQKRFNDPQKQLVDPYWTIIFERAPIELFETVSAFARGFLSH